MAPRVVPVVFVLSDGRLLHSRHLAGEVENTPEQGKFENPSLTARATFARGRKFNKHIEQPDNTIYTFNTEHVTGRLLEEAEQTFGRRLDLEMIERRKYKWLHFFYHREHELKVSRSILLDC